MQTLERDNASVAERRVRALERIAGALRWALALGIALLLLSLLGDVLLLVFAAALLAAGLRGVADRLDAASGLGPGISLAVVVLGAALLLVAAVWWTGPRLVEEATALQDQLATQLAALHDWLQGVPWGRALLRQLPPALGGSAGEGTGDRLGLAPRLAGTVAGALWSAIGLVGTVLLVLAAALYFATAPGSYLDGPLRLLPRPRRARARQVLGAVTRTLRHWLAGQAVDMAVVGTVTGAGLALLGVPLAFVLGVVAGLLNFVPYIGAIGGAVPAVLVALAQGPQQVLLVILLFVVVVILLFVVVQTLEGNVLSPLIQRRAVNLPPAATLLAQTALGTLFGLPGVVLATPLAAAGLAAARELVREDGAGAGEED